MDASGHYLYELTVTEDLLKDRRYTGPKSPGNQARQPKPPYAHTATAGEIDPLAKPQTRRGSQLGNTIEGRGDALTSGGVPDGKRSRPRGN
jgi:hypothetical protein